MKLPLSFTLKNRGSDTGKDARVLNGYVEVIGDKNKGVTVRTYKRPALDSAFELDAGPGQGIYVPNTPDGDGEPGVIINDILTRAPTPKTKKLAFTVQPPTPALNTAFSPSVVVSALTSIGSVASSYISNVVISLDSNPTGATLGGTLTQSAVAGVATFNDLTLNRSGENFTLLATGTNIKQVISNPFDLATSLAFTTQPVDTTEGSAFGVVVTARDSANNTDTNYNGSVTLSIFSGSGSLSGTLTVVAVSGVATFTGLSIDSAGTYQLMATGAEVSTAYTPARTVSTSFVVGNYSITAGTFGGDFGYSFDGGAGSITPTTFIGQFIFDWYTQTSSSTTVFILDGLLPQSFFTSISVNGITLDSSSASYLQAGGRTTWFWVGTAQFSGTGTFSASIV